MLHYLCNKNNNVIINGNGPFKQLCLYIPFKKYMYLLENNKENYVFYSIYLSEISLNVCHSSAFQTISVRSLYIKIINYSDSTLTNLNNIQSKRNNMQRKIFTHIQIETIFNCDYFFFFWRDLKKSYASVFFINSKSWNCVLYIFIFRCAVFVMR